MERVEFNQKREIECRFLGGFGQPKLRECKEERDDDEDIEDDDDVDDERKREGGEEAIEGDSKREDEGKSGRTIEG